MTNKAQKSTLKECLVIFTGVQGLDHSWMTNVARPRALLHCLALRVPTCSRHSCIAEGFTLLILTGNQN